MSSPLCPQADTDLAQDLHSHPACCLAPGDPPSTFPCRICQTVIKNAYLMIDEGYIRPDV